MADNYGSLSTGDHRLMYVSSRLSPTGIGDRTNFVALFTEGNSYVSLTYDWPSGYRGMMLGASASALEYEVVEGAAVDLNLKGTASTARLTMSKPFIRSRLQSLSMQGAVERKVFYNESVFGEESDYVVDVASLGLTYSRVHDILLGGEFSASTTVFLGRNNFNDSPAAFTLAKKNEQVDGHYSMLSASANYTQFINDDYTGMVKFTGQLANDNLDSSSRMYLGGAEAVRAYPSGEAGGSNAFIVNLEVNRTIGDSFTAGLFYDYGYVRQYVSDRNASTGQPLVLGADENRVRLRGGGLSLVWEGASGFTVTSSVSRRIGANPNRSVTGKDSNGRGEKTFFWLQGMARF
jgi:hemolysin activation/secretion protein